MDWVRTATSLFCHGARVLFEHHLLCDVVSTVHRLLDPSEEPSEIVDFWGKTRVSQHRTADQSWGHQGDHSGAVTVCLAVVTIQ